MKKLLQTEGEQLKPTDLSTLDIFYLLISRYGWIEGTKRMLAPKKSLYFILYKVKYKGDFIYLKDKSLALKIGTQIEPIWTSDHLFIQEDE